MQRLFFLTILFLLSSVMTRASSTDTIRVTTHNRATVVTDPQKGFKLYPRWGKFPGADVPVRKITMRVKFGCPDSMRCADWDYMDRISIRRTGGMNGEIQDFELGRMLTPYGGAFGKDWKFEWELDVTDFSMLLRDSVEVEYRHNGYEPNTDRGWAITVEFEIIRGKPAYEPVSITKVYDNSYRYGDANTPLEQVLRPVSFVAAPQASFARLRMVQTGHGMDQPDGCGEFCNKVREIRYDGLLIDSRSIWKECGDNPLYPQAGTWVIDRANWCPGNLMEPDVFDLPVKPGATHVIDARMQQYVSPKPSADEVISAYLIQYKAVKASNDAAVEDILAPSLKPVHSRRNPASANAQIRVRNLGRNPIRSLSIGYGTEGLRGRRHEWKGTIDPGKSAVITLPGTIPSRPAAGIFKAEVMRTNGKADAYKADNVQRSVYRAAPSLPSTLVFHLQTNKQPEHNSYTLTDAAGRVIKGRKRGSLKADTVYRDTLVLEKGAYTLALADTAGDGLELWFNGRGGRGLARLENSTGQMIKSFESDSGSGWEYHFTVEGEPDAVDDRQVAIGLFPTRTSDRTTLDYFGNKPADVLVQLITDPGGTVVEEHKYVQLKEGIFTFNLEHYRKGRFYMKVFANGELKFIKRIRFRE